MIELRFGQLRTCKPLIRVATVLSAFCILTPTLPGATLEHGPLRVEINELGVITSCPGGPIVTVDGPRYQLDSGTSEWFGVEYSQGPVRHSFVGAGNATDWSTSRLAVSPVAFESRSDRAVATVDAQGLRVRTQFAFDSRDNLIVTVELTNPTAGVISDILYSREWTAVPDDPIYQTFPYDLPGIGVASSGVARRFWMLDDLQPGSSGSLTFSFAAPRPLVLGPPPVDVPLVRWTGGSFPAGLNFGETNGISFGDYDADGWINVFACMSGNLWRNLEGTDWELVADLDSVLPFTVRRYGSSFGDYDNDGLPDLGTEPRNGRGGDTCMHLLRNEGLTTFTDIAIDPSLVDLQPCQSDAETICWGDVDCDGDLDCFLPVYPAWAGGGPGNFFLTNLGPTGPGSEYRFTENSGPVGLDNPPPASARPEGAQFVDIDADGDMDLYCNGTLYQNNSSLGSPSFDAMREQGSGIGLSTSLEEGAAFFDYDLDGDYDFAVVYTGPGVRIWENRGDGTFFGRFGIVESPGTGLDLGLSAEDWDNDGDIDFTTRQVFRRNMLAETGVAEFIVASTDIIPSHLTSATPSWGDWDKDGDLDAALGNWLSTGNFYQNELYDASTPDDQRRYVRVRVLRDSVSVPAGLETEYGADVEVFVRGDDSGYRRRKFVASSHGYLNQNEYTLHFALPDDPNPADPSRDLTFDVVVDFPTLPSEGFLRIDGRINSALSGIRLADLANREIVVLRSGRVVIDGVETLPPGDDAAFLTTAAGGLALPDPDFGLPDPVAIANTLGGIAFDTIGATTRVRIREILVDGCLRPGSFCGEPTNVRVWDVTDASEPFVVPGGNLQIPYSEENERTIFPVDVLLDIEREYRMVAELSASRGTLVGAPVAHDQLTVTGGVLFLDQNPCAGNEAALATVDPSQIYLSFRFGEVSFVSDVFTRGDCNDDGITDISDPVQFLETSFAGGAAFACADACDFNDDGMLDVADAVYALEALFVDGAPIPPPVGDCGFDPTPDPVECIQTSSCD